MIGGCQLPALDVVDAYLHAAITAGAADVPARLITLRDLLELERAPGFDADSVLAHARDWGVEAPLVRAIGLVERELRPDVAPALAGWARTRRPSGPERRLLACYTSPRRSVRRALATVVALGSWRDRMAFGRAMLMPQPAYRAAKGWTRRDYLARVGRRIAATSRGSSDGRTPDRSGMIVQAIAAGIAAGHPVGRRGEPPMSCNST